MLNLIASIWGNYVSAFFISSLLKLFLDWYSFTVLMWLRTTCNTYFLTLIYQDRASWKPLQKSLHFANERQYAYLLWKPAQTTLLLHGFLKLPSISSSKDFILFFATWSIYSTWGYISKKKLKQQRIFHSTHSSWQAYIQPEQMNATCSAIARSE